MEFLFFESGVNNGHAIFKNESHGARIEVSEGRGSATKVHVFRVQAGIHQPVYDTNSAVRLCRIAIAKFLGSRGAFASLSYIEERDESWGGKLEPLN